MGTIKTLIEDALREIIVLAEGDQASDDQIEDGKRKLISMLKLWAVDGMMVPYITTETFTLNTTRSSNTWLPGGQWNSTSPVSVIGMSFQLGQYQNPLERMDRRTFLQLPNTGVVGEPRFFMFETSATGPTVYFDRTPYGGAMKVSSLKPFDTSFALTDETEFPDYYDEVLRTHLSIRMCPSNNKSATAELVAIAKESMKVAKRYNSTPVPNMRTSLPTQHSGSFLPFRTG